MELAEKFRLLNSSIGTEHFNYHVQSLEVSIYFEEKFCAHYVTALNKAKKHHQLWLHRNSSISIQKQLSENINIAYLRYERGGAYEGLNREAMIKFPDDEGLDLVFSCEEFESFTMAHWHGALLHHDSSRSTISLRGTISLNDTQSLVKPALITTGSWDSQPYCILLIGLSQFDPYLMTEFLSNKFLTPKEKELSVLLTQGFCNKELAKILQVSSRMVESAIQTILIKTGHEDHHSFVTALLSYSPDLAL